MRAPRSPPWCCPSMRGIFSQAAGPPMAASAPRVRDGAAGQAEKSSNLLAGIESGSRERLHLLGHGAVEDGFEAVERARHGRAVHHAMIVEDPDVHEPIRVDRPVVEERGQRRERVERLRAEPGIDRKMEGAKVVCPLPAEVQAEPHYEAPDRRRKSR